MAKRIKYKVGDVFCIQMEGNHYGYGRIIKLDNPIIFIELYNKVTIQRIVTVEELMGVNVILSIWCVDRSIKNGEWEIVGNVPIDSNYKMPNFWTKSPMTESILLYKAGDTFESLKNAIVITEDQIGEAQPYGVYGHIAVKNVYKNELSKLNGL